MSNYKFISKHEFNEDLDGFVVTFKSGSIAHTQFNTESNRLHADFGERCLERYEEYDEGELTESEAEELALFISDNSEVKAKDVELNN